MPLTWDIGSKAGHTSRSRTNTNWWVLICELHRVFLDGWCVLQISFCFHMFWPIDSIFSYYNVRTSYYNSYYNVRIVNAGEGMGSDQNVFRSHLNGTSLLPSYSLFSWSLLVEDFNEFISQTLVISLYPTRSFGHSYPSKWRGQRAKPQANI